MSYKESSSYVQRQIDVILKSFKHFVKVYVNDIIAHSRFFNNYLIHLRQLFDLYRRKRINLSFSKSFLKYSSITLLDQKVNSLKLSIFIEKIATIITLQLSKSLSDLEFFLNLTK